MTHSYDTMVWQAIPFILLLLLGIGHGNVRVETPLGSIVGKPRVTETGTTFAAFTGIPYIQPPVGDLRFKPPVPVEPFKEDFYATDDDKICAQDLFGGFMGSEDCVILNVFTPWTKLSPTLSVMVYFHGGGYIVGASITSFLGMPDYLIENDIVLVTINNRLGVFGFLSTGDAEASGNYGLLDQVEALKWVQSNIAAFGGNPDQVTIVGQSAGAGSVNHHMLSPLSKGLFHGAIAQSGSSLCSWAITEISGEYAKLLAEKVGCPTSTSSELLECLRLKDAEQLVMTSVLENDKKAAGLPLVWVPRIDQEAEFPLLPDHPINIMNSGSYNKVPLLIGFTKDEDEGFVGLQNEATAEQIIDGWDNYCKVFMNHRDFKISEEKGTELCNQVEDYYIDRETCYDKNVMAYVKMNQDMHFTAGIFKAVELMAEHNPVYIYVLNYDNGEFSLWSMLDPRIKHVQGTVCHADDLLYLFKYPQIRWTTDSPAYKMVQMMTNIWTDFVKTGKPKIPQLQRPWPRATRKKSKYVAIDIIPTIEEDYRPGDLVFMNYIYSQTVFNTSIAAD